MKKWGSGDGRKGGKVKKGDPWWKCIQKRRILKGKRNGTREENWGRSEEDQVVRTGCDVQFDS